MTRSAVIRLRFAIGAVALACLPWNAGAAPSPLLNDCLNAVIDNEHSSRWPAVTVCYESELSAQERRLQAANQALDTSAARLDARARQQIASSHSQWLLYRDSWCAFEQDYAKAPNADIARLSCRIDVTKAQADRAAEQAAALR